MIYENTITAEFISRPNRFIANVLLEGNETVVHVKNTGRCRELLIPGSKVILQRAQDPNRKTSYDLISVYKGDTLINMDSNATNKVFGELAKKLFPGALIKPEQRWGDSRFDFYIEQGREKAFCEVKGVTLENDGVASFPDAPTVRGVKHLRELIACTGEGYKAYIAFIVQMKGIKYLTPNDITHPEFGAALREAAAAGVNILCYDCIVRENSLTADKPIPVKL